MDQVRENIAAQTLVIKTPRTDAARFTISKADVGTEAVRPGCMQELEEDRRVLLMTAKLVLSRIRSGQVSIGAPYEFALEQAIKLAELR